jgi:cytoskeletal protein CcmA (bactofilin family)
MRDLMLELQPKARIEGDVHYRALEMHQGAIISGQLRPIGCRCKAHTQTGGKQPVGLFPSELL